jgi:hypothetical protein
MSRLRISAPGHSRPMIVRIAGEGRWSLPNASEGDLRVLDNALTRAVDDVREDEYERLLAGVCAFVRRRGIAIAPHDRAGGADITVPPPGLPLAGAVDALYDGPGLSAESTALRAR